MEYRKGEDVEFVLKATKDSDSGIFRNQRLLLIKSGIICYFSEVPKKFMGSARAVQLSGQLPKYAIAANDIDHIHLKGGVLSMLFKKSKLISRNIFQGLVQGDGKDFDSMSQVTEKADDQGFIKWVFECEDTDMMQEFCRLTNLFRNKDPNFKPNLLELVIGYQPKQWAERQMSWVPSMTQTMVSPGAVNKRRMSQMPTTNNSDTFLESLGFLDKKPKPAEPVVDKKRVQVPTPMTPQDHPQAEEKARLSKVVNRLSTTNIPGMGIIDEGQNEDKMSELSKNTRLIIPEEKSIQYEKESPPVKQQSGKSKEEDSKLAEPVEQVKIDLNQPSTTQQIPLGSEKSIEDQSPDMKKKKEFSPPKIKVEPGSPRRHMSPSTPSSPQRSPRKITFVPNTIIESRYNSHKQKVSQSYLSESEVVTSQKLDNQKRRLLAQLIRAKNWVSGHDYRKTSEQLGMTVEEIQLFLSENPFEDESTWKFIENTLSFLLSVQTPVVTEQDVLTGQKPAQQMKINQQVITDYHSLQKSLDQSREQIQPGLFNDMSMQACEEESSEYLEVRQWAESQIKSPGPKPLSSKSFGKNNFTMHIRSLQFVRSKVIALKNGWLVNSGGYLEDFLAYVRLERALKEVSKRVRSDIELTCGEVFYLKHREYEGIVRQWRVGYYSRPLKAMKGLDYLNRCKDLRAFEQDFPQFAMVAETIEEEESSRFRIHLQRISPHYKSEPIEQEMGKLHFGFENELGVFYSTDNYKQLEDECLKQLNSIIASQKTISDDSLYQCFEAMSSNIAVDTICKLIGCRIDKRGDLYFHHTVLKLGHRQFGQELTLIRRAIKRDNIELARQLSKKLMARVQRDGAVTPMTHYIQIYLQLIDLVVVGKNDLQRAVAVLLQILGLLGNSEVQQFPVYLSLMKTYLKLGKVSDFIKVMENCRKFLTQMFSPNTLLIDVPFQKVIIMILLKQNPASALQLANNLVNMITENTTLGTQLKDQYLSQVSWLRNNILVTENRAKEAFQNCIISLNQLDESGKTFHDYWVDGILCLCNAWMHLKDINIVNCMEVQKKIQRALELAFTKNNMEVVFVLYETGCKVIEKCSEEKLPTLLAHQKAYQQAKIDYEGMKNSIEGALMEVPSSPSA